MLKLLSRYSEHYHALRVTIKDEGKWASDYLYDDQLKISSDRAALKQNFMNNLCDDWFHLFGTRVEAIKQAENVEWIVRYVDETDNPQHQV